MRAMARRQDGAALLVVLVMLVVVGMLAVTGAEDVQLQTKMSVNSRDYERAYYNAESTLTTAEAALQTNLGGTWTEGSFGSVQGLLLTMPGSALPLDAQDRADVIAKGIGVDEGGATIGAYAVEYLGKVGEPTLNQANEDNAADIRLDGFRVTALGLGGAGQASWAVVQSELRLGPFF